MDYVYSKCMHTHIYMHVSIFPFQRWQNVAGWYISRKIFMTNAWLHSLLDSPKLIKTGINCTFPDLQNDLVCFFNPEVDVMTDSHAFLHRSTIMSIIISFYISIIYTSLHQVKWSSMQIYGPRGRDFLIVWSIFRTLPYVKTALDPWYQ